MKAEEIGKEFAEVSESCAAEAFRLLEEIQSLYNDKDMPGNDSGAFYMVMSERAARVSSLLKVTSVLEGLSLIGLVECPECGNVFNACHHRANESRQSKAKPAPRWSDKIE